ncbi:hypothetical protein VTK73DRAFT_1626 [Phialemonium thermophilum]|uniref:SMP-30/Gluconolactonase/LRE-like region domain-containing protein n=1 Tax=Phialemonium thermophilum TaxID=223376 RepID=A0ABR3VTA8_9PEZI
MGGTWRTDDHPRWAGSAHALASCSRTAPPTARQLITRAGGGKGKRKKEKRKKSRKKEEDSGTLCWRGHLERLISPTVDQKSRPREPTSSLFLSPLAMLEGWGFPQPRQLTATVAYRLPDEFRRPGGQSEHSRNQKRGRPVDSFLEGPVYVRETGTLYVTDIPYGRVFAVDLATGAWRLVVEYEGGEPNGMAWHPAERRLYVADFCRGILRLDPATGRVETLLDRWNGEHLRGPNDLVLGGDGSVFFTDQGMTGLQDPTGRVFRLHPPTGRVDLLLRNCPSPNGLVLDAAETTLFVAQTRDNAVWCAPLYPDGSVQRTGRFASYGGVGGPDGLALDVEGNLFVAHSTLGCVFVHRPNGLPLARIQSPAGHGTTNLTWGGPDLKTLYIVESQSGSILTVPWHCPGVLGKLYAGWMEHDH